MDTISVKLRFTYNSNSTIYINSATEITCPSLREITNKSASKSKKKLSHQLRKIIYKWYLRTNSSKESVTYMQQHWKIILVIIKITHYKIKLLKLLFYKWVVIIRLFTMFRAHCISISHSFWRQNCHFYKF